MAVRWSTQELLDVLDIYLSGYGLLAASHCRGLEATANVIRSDIPRDYRGCVKWLEGPKSRRRRKGASWHPIEVRYLMRLRKRGRTDSEIELILGRDGQEIMQQVMKIEPRHSGRGFF